MDEFGSWSRRCGWRATEDRQPPGRRNIPGGRLLEICNRTTGPHGVIDSEAEKLRDDAWQYRDLRIRIADERVQEALAQLIAEREEQLRQIEEEPTVDR
jgi:hypothetical protein